ncbi:MAG TPA: hypothetical protein VEY30_10050, partial [Myxococcaceae bacterium]|nr:hypothetical protein [Myxococcaceae bacterium]
ALDVRADFETEDEARFTYHGGGEYFVTEGVPVRLGYARDELNRTQFWSTGLGLLGTGAGIDLAYRHEMGGRGGRLLSATVRVVVN